jgi:hypothetical protein
MVKNSGQINSELYLHQNLPLKFSDDQTPSNDKNGKLGFNNKLNE